MTREGSFRGSVPVVGILATRYLGSRLSFR